MGAAEGGGPASVTPSCCPTGDRAGPRRADTIRGIMVSIPRRRPDRLSAPLDAPGPVPPGPEDPLIHAAHVGEVGAGELGAVEVGAGEVGAGEVGAGEVGAGEVGVG